MGRSCNPSSRKGSQMKQSLLIVAMTLAITPSLGIAAEKLKGSVYWPDKGVICDKKAGFCSCKTKQNACYGSKYSDKIDKKTTQALFGKLP